MQAPEQCALLAEDIEAYDREVGDGYRRNYTAWLEFAAEHTKQSPFGGRDAIEQEAQRRRREAFFPRKEDLAKQYPAVKRHGWLYPVFWAKRAARSLLDKDRRKVMQRVSLKRNVQEVQALEDPETDRKGILADMQLVKQEKGRNRRT